MSVAKEAPGVRALKEAGRDYYGFWVAEGGKKESVRFRNCTEKQAARVRLNEHLQKPARHRAGLGPHPKDATAWEQSSVEQHLQAYIGRLRKEGRADRYVAEVELQARAVIDGVGAEAMAELTADTVATFLAELSPRGDPPRAPSARTRET